MLEAVGKEYWPVYFDTIRNRLRPGGIAVLQVITMAEDRYAAYETSADFIQRHIFPGGMLPSDGVMRSGIAAAGLLLDGVRTFGMSYARTLADWRIWFRQPGRSCDGWVSMMGSSANGNITCHIARRGFAPARLTSAYIGYAGPRRLAG